LIGVQTKVPANDQMHSGQTWIGSPAMLLPARETLVGFPDALTFRPRSGGGSPAAASRACASSSRSRSSSPPVT